jgi:LysR family transcriptional regulator, transcriptional activator of nhaA
MRGLNFNHLYNFHVVARAGSLSEGARQLGLAASTVSEQLGQLETTVGRRLFDRTASGLRLTAEGRTAVEHTTVMFAAADRLASALRTPAAPPEPHLEVDESPVSRTRRS